jgi:subtilisin family serine protease
VTAREVPYPPERIKEAASKMLSRNFTLIALLLGAGTLHSQTMEYELTGTWNANAERTEFSAPNTTFRAAFSLPVPLTPTQVGPGPNQFYFYDVQLSYTLGETTKEYTTGIAMTDGLQVSILVAPQPNIRVAVPFLTGPPSSPTLLEGSFPSTEGFLDTERGRSHFTGRITAFTPSRKRDHRNTMPGLYHTTLTLPDWRIEVNVSVSDMIGRGPEANIVAFAWQQGMYTPVIFTGGPVTAPSSRYVDVVLTTKSAFPPMQLTLTFPAPDQVRIVSGNWGDSSCVHDELRKRATASCLPLPEGTTQPDRARLAGYYRGASVSTSEGAMTPHIFVMNAGNFHSATVRFSIAGPGGDTRFYQDAYPVRETGEFTSYARRTPFLEGSRFSYSLSLLDNGAVHLTWTPPGASTNSQFIPRQPSLVVNGEFAMPVLNPDDPQTLRNARVNLNQSVISVLYQQDQSRTTGGGPVHNGAFAYSVMGNSGALYGDIAGGIDGTGALTLFTTLTGYGGSLFGKPSVVLSAPAIPPRLGYGLIRDFSVLGCTALQGEIFIDSYDISEKRSVYPPTSASTLRAMITWRDTSLSEPVQQFVYGQPLLGKYDSPSCGRINYEIRFASAARDYAPVLWIELPTGGRFGIVVSTNSTSITYCMSGVTFTGNETFVNSIIAPAAVVHTRSDGLQTVNLSYSVRDRRSNSTFQDRGCTANSVRVDAAGRFSGTATGACGSITFSGELRTNMHLLQQSWTPADGSPSVTLTASIGAPFAPQPNGARLFMLSPSLQTPSRLPQTSISPVAFQHSDLARNYGDAVTLALVYNADSSTNQEKVAAVTLPLLNGSFASLNRGDFQLVRGCVSIAGLHLWADIDNGKGNIPDALALRLAEIHAPAPPADGSYEMSDADVFSGPNSKYTSLSIKISSRSTLLNIDYPTFNRSAKANVPASGLPLTRTEVQLENRVLSAVTLFVDIEGTGRVEFPITAHAIAPPGLPGFYLKPSAGGYEATAVRANSSGSFSVDTQRLNTSSTAAYVLRELKKQPRVLGAFGRILIPAGAVPTDPCYTSAGNCGGTLDKFFRAAQLVDGARDAWSITQGSGVRIAILDTGVNFNHPDLPQGIRLTDMVPRIPAGQNISVTSESNAFARQYSGDLGLQHGTPVLGIIGAIHNNNRSVAGVAPAASLEMYRVGDDGPSVKSVFDALVSIVESSDPPHIVSMSFGHRDEEKLDSYMLPFANIVQRLAEKGVLVTVMAGNAANFPIAGKDSLTGEARSPNVLSVGAWHPDRSELTTYSSWGYRGPDIVAPSGENSPPDKLAVLKAPASTGAGHAGEAGTSLSTPIVAGAAALVLSKNPGLKVNTSMAIATTMTGNNRRCANFAAENSALPCLQQLIAVLLRSSTAPRIPISQSHSSEQYARDNHWIPLRALSALDARPGPLNDPNRHTQYDPLPRPGALRVTGCGSVAECRTTGLTIGWDPAPAASASYGFLGYLVYANGLYASPSFHTPSNLHPPYIPTFTFIPEFDTNGAMVQKTYYFQVIAVYQGTSMADAGTGPGTIYRSLASGGNPKTFWKCDGTQCASVTY